MFYLLFIDGISTYILAGLMGFKEKNFLLNVINYHVSEWALTIIIWILIVFLVFYFLRKILGYNLRREYRAVVLIYIFSLLIAVAGNLYILLFHGAWIGKKNIQGRVCYCWCWQLWRNHRKISREKQGVWWYGYNNRNPKKQREQDIKGRIKFKGRRKNYCFNSKKMRQLTNDWIQAILIGLIYIIFIYFLIAKLSWGKISFYSRV